MRNSTRLKIESPDICLLTETFYPIVGGGETHARLLASQLNAGGMPLIVLTRRIDPYLPTDEFAGNTQVIRIPPVRMKRFAKYAMIPFTLAELMRRKRQYDIVFVCGFRVLGLPAMVASWLLGKKCVLRAESLGEMSGKYASAHKKLGLSRIPFKMWIGFRNRMLKKADAFISICGPMTEEFAGHGVNSRRIFEIPNGIDTDKFHPVEPDLKRSLRENLGLPPQGTIAVYTGKLNRGKGVEHLISAWNSVKAHHADAHLVLVGSGEGQTISLEDELRRSVKEKKLTDCVTFTGYVENVHEYLQASDMFVFPTEYEAFGLSLVEAMSCGLPVIASKVGGIPEIVSHGKNGILIRPGDSKTLAKAILFLINRPNSAAILAKRARRTVGERYSIETVAERYIDLFTSLHSGREKHEK